MIRQASEGLNADDVGNAALDQLHHLARQEPPLTGLVADIDDGLCILDDLVDAGRRLKVPALLVLAVNGPQRDVLDGVDRCLHAEGRLFGGAQIIGLVHLVVEAVQHKAHQIRNNGLRALGLQRVDQVIVGRVGVFYQDLADDADPGLFEALVNRNRVEIADDVAAHALHLVQGEALRADQEFGAGLCPLLVHGLHGALFQLVGPHAVDAFHQHITENNGEGQPGNKGERDLKAGVPLEPGEVCRDDRNLLHAGLFQRTADKADVVGGTASAARLRHDHGCVIEIVLAGGERLHDLPDDKEGRVAGIVVHVFESVIHRSVVVVAHQDHIVAAGSGRRLNEIKMNGRHLGAEDGVLLVEHLLRKRNLFDAGGVNGALERVLFPDIDGRNQRADADSGGAQVVHLINLEAGIDLVGAGEDVAHLIGGYCIHAASEGVELDQIQIISGTDVGGSRIEAGVIHPLIEHDERPLGGSQVRDGVLGEDGKAVRMNHFRDAVVDLRIQVIRASCQNDALCSGVLHELQNALALGLDVLPVLQELIPSGLSRCQNLTLRELGEFPRQRLGYGLEAGEGHEGMTEGHLPVHDLLNVVLDILRVGGDNRAVVVVVRILIFLPLIEKRGIEDEVGMRLFNQPLHVAVGDLGGVAFRFGGDGLDAHLVNRVCRQRREDYAVAEPGKERCPEGVILIHVQNARDADGAAHGLLGRQRLVAEEALELVLVHVRNAVVGLLKAKAPLAPVAGNELPSVIEVVDGQTAVVAALSAAAERCLKGQRLHLLQTEHGGGLGGIEPLPCDQSGAERTHDAGDVRTDHIAAGNLLERAQHGVVVEGAALHDDIFAKLRSGGHLHYLEQRVFDDRIGKACRNVGDARALLLCLLDAGVHENRAPRAEVDGILCKKSRLRKVHHRIVQGFCKGLDKGSAPGGTGLVERDGIHGAVADADALHILSADVENAVHLRVKIRCAVVVRDGFDLAPVQPERGLHQGFAVSGGAAAGNRDAGGKVLIQIGDAADGGLNGRAVVGGIEGPEQLAVFSDECELGRSGAGVNPEEGLALVGGEVFFLHAVAAVAGGKGVVFRLIGEQRLHTLNLEFHLHGMGGFLQKCVQQDGIILLGLEGGAHGREEMGVLYLDGVLLVQVQLADKGRLQLG